MRRIGAPAGSLLLLLAGSAWLCAGGCLNPRPEELPSNGAPASGPGDGDFIDLEGNSGEDLGETPRDPSEGDPLVPTTPGSSTPPPAAGEPADAGAPDAAPEPDAEVVEAPG